MAPRRALTQVALAAALLLALPPAAAVAAPQWVGAETLAPAGGTPDVTTDAQGNSAAVWYEGGRALAALRPHGGPWRDQEDLDPGAQVDAQDPKIVALPGGEFVALWVGGDFGSDVRAARRPFGGGWSAPVVINTTCCPDLQDLVVGADGTVLGYWTSRDGTPETAVKRPGSASWDTPQDLPRGRDDTQVAVAPDGSAVAAHPANCGESSFVNCVQADHRPRNGTWSAVPEDVGEAAGAVSGLALTARQGSSYTVAWAERPAPVGGVPTPLAVRSADRAPGPGGGWTGPQTVAGGEAGCPRSFGCIDLATRGSTLAAVWQRGGEIAASLRPGDSPWSSAERVGDVTGGDAFPQAAITAAAKPVAAWGGVAGAAVARGAQRLGAGPWAQEDLGGTAEGTVVVGDVVADEEGDAVTAWRDPDGARAAGFDGTGPRFDLFSAPTPTTAGATQPFAAEAVDNWSGLAALTWLFGDGGTAEGAQVNYAYANPGEYTATARARDSLDNVSERSGPVGVAATPTPTPTPTCGTTDADGDGINDLCDDNDGARRPVPFRTVNATVVSGDVFVKLPAGAARAAQGAKPPKGFVRLEGAETIPVRSTLDTSNGRVALRTAADTRRRTQRAVFSRGRFVIRQVRAPRGKSRRRSTKLITDLRLTGSSFRRACRARTATVSQRRRSKRRVRRLFGDGRGRFRTSGRNAAATVRGTRWGVQDRCDGTLVTVRQGRVSVRDLVRRRTVTVRAGRTYLARRR